jgi:hypothetical protein
MVYRGRLRRDADGLWIASAVERPPCWSRAATREVALRKLRDEIRYRIELCPCSSVDKEFVKVELLAEEAALRSRRPVERAEAQGGHIEAIHPGRGWQRWDD